MEAIGLDHLIAQKGDLPKLVANFRKFVVENMNTSENLRFVEEMEALLNSPEYNRLLDISNGPQTPETVSLAKEALYEFMTSPAAKRALQILAELQTRTLTSR